MTPLTSIAFKAALSALHYTGVARLLKPITAGNGVIFMLHHVTPQPAKAFDPNGILRITPDFLERVINQVRASGYDIIALDDVPQRLKNPRSKPFAVFTLDDGYRDNRDYAYPVFKRLECPFTIYVPTAYADGKGDLWWLSLEEAVRRLDNISIEIDGTKHEFKSHTASEKGATFDKIYWSLRNMHEDDARAVTHRLAEQAGFDPISFCRDLVMNWDELRQLVKDPLVTIGAHTCGHYALSLLPEDSLRGEIGESKRRIEQELSRPCHHFSYPYGCERSAGDREFAITGEFGFKTAVTTRKDLIHAIHRDNMMALPRFSLNGNFQDARYFKVLLSGLPFFMWNLLSRLKGKRKATVPPSLVAVPAAE